MKKKYTLSLWVMLVTVVAAMAAPVSEQQARQVAGHFWQTLRGKQQSQAAFVNVTASTPFAHIYLFEAVDGKGFVAVAAEDVARPILGYSATHGVGETLAEGARYWLQCLDDEIDYALQHHWEATDEVQGLWQSYYREEPQPLWDAVVSPLVTTTWNQGQYYNDLCPVDANSYNNGRCPTGCVATAMAQVMKRWNHPVTGTGSHSYTSLYGTESANFGSTTYQWSSMPSALSSTSTAAQVLAVATLMYHVGVSVEMSYNTYASSAVTTAADLTSVDAENALRWYFGYKNSIHSVPRGTTMPADWAVVLKGDLDAGRPILYSGRDTAGGHAFVCDGYDNNDYFHFNWGWGGYCDGYYPLDALAPAAGGIGGNATYTFNLRQWAVMGIEPLRNSNSNRVVNLTSSNALMGSVSGSGTYSAGDTITISASANDGYRFVRWSDGAVFNPRRMLVDTVVNLTAQFAAVRGDTLHYEEGAYRTSWALGSTSEWAVKFNPQDLTGYTSLSAISIYNAIVSQTQQTSGISYELSVYQGGASAPQTFLDSIHVTLTTTGWQVLPLHQPLAIDTTQTLWIVAYSGTDEWPVASSYYAGTGNSCYRKYGTDWYVFSYGSDNYSWMLRGVLQGGSGAAEDSTVTVTGVANTNLGYVTGGGTYHVGDTVMLTAMARPGFRFVHWSNEMYANPLPIVVEGDTTLVANYTTVNGNPLQYDNNRYRTSIGLGTATPFSWASRFRPEDYAGYNNSVDSLRVVLPPNITDTFTYSVWQGGDTVPATQLAVQQLAVVGDTAVPQWATLAFDAPVLLDTTLSLWLVISANHTAFPAAASNYAGTPEGSYYYEDGAWHNMVNEGMNYSWLLRADMSYQTVPDTGATYLVSVTASPATMGVVLGGGTYTQGQVATIAAVPAAGHQFRRWSDGPEDNPRSFTVTSHVSYTALFATADTVYVHENTTQYDTVYVATHDSIYVTTYDTVYLTAYDTVFLTEYDSIYLTQYDTVYVSQPCDSVDYYTLTVASANEQEGLAAGSGTFAAGTQVQIAAVPLQGYTFAQWDDGSSQNPRTVTVSADATYTATFSHVGVEEAQPYPFQVYTIGDYIVVDNAAGQRVRVFDVVGRQMVTRYCTAESLRVQMPASGAYMVQVGDAPARKVIVVK